MAPEVKSSKKYVLEVSTQKLWLRESKHESRVAPKLGNLSVSDVLLAVVA